MDGAFAMAISPTLAAQLIHSLLWVSGKWVAPTIQLSRFNSLEGVTITSLGAIQVFALARFLRHRVTYFFSLEI